MLFNSLQFLVFFPLVAGLYFATPQRFRWMLLLAASYYFYMCWRPEYVVLIIASTAIDYFAGLRMGACATRVERRKYLWLSLIANLGLLFTFKYVDFASESLNEIVGFVGVSSEIPMLHLLLPIGISFYTFQTLSYSIDVYRGRRKPERHFGMFAVYVAFFPQLVAGPIERSVALLPQFREIHRFDYQRAKEGLTLMMWGFFKKLVIADQAAIYVDSVYANPSEQSGLSLLVGSYLFAFQIYCDFSGYSDIAIGSSRVLGFRLTENFRRPLLSRSISEFWERWHITLTSWFRDYVYIPLGGSRVSSIRTYQNVGAVFLLSGLWHGAAWHFVIWGLYHATLHGLNRLCGTGLARLAPVSTIGSWVWGGVCWLVTFHLVTFGWILFRADSMSDAVGILTTIATGTTISAEALLAGHSAIALLAMVLPSAFLISVELQMGDRSFPNFIASRSEAARLLLYLTLIFAIAVLGVFDGEVFIYFQF